MKRPSSITLPILCTLLLLFIVSCNQESKKDEPVPPIVEAPSNIISLNEADVIYDNYTKHRVQLIEPYEQQRIEGEDFTAGRFVDFDYDTIKQYIEYIDQEAKNAGVKKVTKLRLYFANYPNTDKFPNGKKVIHKRQNSIFMVPTLDKGGINYGFFIGANGNAQLIRDWKDGTMDKIGFITTSDKAQAGIMPNFSLNSNLQESKSLALNFGQGGPPPKTDF